MIFVPSMIGSIFAIVFSIDIITGPSLKLAIPNILPFFNLEIFVDGVSAFFILIIGIVSFAVSLYSIGYSKEYEAKKRISAFGFLFNIFVLSMILVVSSNNAFFFLVFWEKKGSYLIYLNIGSLCRQHNRNKKFKVIGII